MQRLDLVGEPYGQLTVLECAGKDNTGRVIWRCRCSCGTETTKSTSLLRSGKVRSCGCLRKVTAAAHCRAMTRHGHYSDNKPTPEWSTWAAMRARCAVPTHAEFPNYGGRGITVCPSWQTFENFLADMGRRPARGFSIDRIDNTKGYGPDNCRWATPQTQNNNTRGNRRIAHAGVTRTVAEWCRELGVSRGLFKQRIVRLGSHEAALADIVNWLTAER